MTFRPAFAWKNASFRLGGAMLAAFWILAPGIRSAWAAQVRGTFVAYEGAAPRGNRYLHFQNRATRDSYMVPTGADGTFTAQLPPGRYDLRAERGAILTHAINVEGADIALGQVSDLAPYAPARLWHLQSIAPSLLVSPAPSTANILTADSTVLPPVAVTTTNSAGGFGMVSSAPAPDSSSEAPNLSEPDFGPPHAVAPRY